ncbi:MAG: DUF3761 domain-containing protein [Patescibacteria group bacterium]
MPCFWRKTAFLFATLALVGQGCVADVPSPSSTPVPAPIVQPQFQLEPAIKPVEEVSEIAPAKDDTPIKWAPETQEPTTDYAPSGTYTNVDGNEVPSPYYAPSSPAGASARCRDGTYSFSQNRRGTCSHHGGVEEWLY